MAGPAIALSSRLSGTAAQFALAAVLARVVGASGVGVYFLAIAWGRLCENLIGAGYPQVIVRSTAAATSSRQRRAYLYQGVRGTTHTVILAVGVLIIAQLLPIPEQVRFAFQSGLLLGITGAIIRLGSEFFKGSRKPNTGLLLEFVLVPLSVLAAVVVASASGRPLSAETVVVVHIAVASVLSLVVVGISRRSASGVPQLSERGRREFWLWNIFNHGFSSIPVIVLPLFAPAATIGVFAVAQRLVALATIVLAALSAVFSPRFAAAAARHDMRRIRGDFFQSRRLAMVMFLPFGVVFFVTPGTLLGLFGNSFVEGSVFLRILAVGQAFNAATGLSAEWLNMAGQERREVGILIISTLTLLGMSVSLGSIAGALGVAVAFASAMALKNVWSFIAVRRALAANRFGGA